MRSSNSTKSGPPEPDLVEIGTIIRPHGYKGGFVVFTPSGKHSTLAVLTEFYVGSDITSVRRLSICESSWMPKGWLLRTSEIQSDSDVAPLIGKKVYGDRALFPKTDEKEHYVIDLIGAAVIDEESGKTIGQLIGVEFASLSNTKGHDWWVVEYSGRQVLVPAVSEYIAAVEKNPKRIFVKRFSTLL